MFRYDLAIDWIITSRCNFKCPYCQAWDGDHSSRETVNALLDCLVSFRGSRLVNISGGEPPIHPQFFDVCKTLAHEKIDIALDTNLSHKRPVIENILDACGSSLIDVTATFHPQSALWKQFVDNARYLIARGINLYCKLVADHRNFENIKQILQRFKEEDIPIKLGVEKIQRLKDIRKHGDIIARYSDEYRKWLEMRLPDNSLARKFLDGKTSFQGRVCKAGKTYVTIDEEGFIWRCPTEKKFKGKVRLGRVDKEGFSHLLEKPLKCNWRYCFCGDPYRIDLLTDDCSRTAI